MRVHRCGPLLNYWTVRYEAKHRYFKYIAKLIKNVAKTLAHRHQRHLCYLLANPEKYLVDSVEFGPGKHIEHLYAGYTFWEGNASVTVFSWNVPVSSW